MDRIGRGEGEVRMGLGALIVVFPYTSGAK